MNEAAKSSRRRARPPGWTDAGARNATERATAIWKKLLQAYEPPPLDLSVKEAIDARAAERIEEIGGA